MRVDAPAHHTGTLPAARRIPDWVLVAVATVVAVAVVAVLARDPARVDVITISNATPYRVTVDASSADGGGTVRIGSVGRDATSAFRQVVDHGERWVLAFSYAGRSGGTVEVSRDELVAGWEVPAGVGEELARQGVRPSSSFDQEPVAEEAPGAGDAPLTDPAG